MKKTRVVATFLVIVLVMQMLTMGVLAGPPAGTWISGIQVQNLDLNNDATITVRFYWAAGTPNAGQEAYSFIDTIPAGKARAYHVPSITGVPSNFVGSVVISSDYEIAAILNTANQGTGSAGDPKRVGTAAGVSDTSQEVYAPYLRKNYYGYNSYIAVQNTGSTTATVVVRYIDHLGATLASAQETVSVPAYSSKLFYQNDNAALPNDFHGSAVITGTEQLAVLVNVHNASTSVATSGFESYNGFVGGAQKLYLPKLSINYYGYQGGFTIQNIGTAATVMTMTYKYGGATYTKVSGLVQPGSSWGVFLASYANSGLPAGLSGVGSGIVEATQPMVALVSERNDSYGFVFNSAGVADGSGTSTILLPKFDSNFYDYNGGITIQNVGTTTTTVQATFSMSGRTDKVITSSAIAPGAMVSWYGPSVVPALGSGFVGSVVVTSLNGQPIAGVYTSRNTVLQGDTSGSYNGINK